MTEKTHNLSNSETPPSTEKNRLLILLQRTFGTYQVPLSVAAVLLFAVAFNGFLLAAGPAADSGIYKPDFEGGPDVEEVVTYEAGVEADYSESFFENSFVSPIFFLTTTGSSGTTPPESETSFMNIQGTTLIASTNPLTTFTSVQDRDEVIIYRVEEGDTPSGIAAAFGISTHTLLWANKLKDGDYIKPGDELTVLPVSGVLHTVKKGETLAGIAKTYKGDLEKTIAFNGLPANGTVIEGERIVIPDGEMPPPPRPPQRRYVSTAQAASRVSSPISAGYYIYPTTGRNWGRRHANNGVDIANSCGTPIYAAAEGRVVTSDPSGWNGGFGKFVKISHSNGTATLYAHHSQNLVAAGDYVAQGQLISYMGTTGRSTGCHLHFEVHGARNPLIRY